MNEDIEYFMNEDIEYLRRYLRHADKTALEALERIEKFAKVSRVIMAYSPRRQLLKSFT